MLKLGLDLPKDEVNAIMKKHDLSNDQTICYEEFKKIFTLD
jgi:Ca2+-binding EF-hand superfamily protein